MSKEFELSYSASEIDEKLGKAGNAILFTEQELSNEQQKQAMKNIGIPFGKEISDLYYSITEFDALTYLKSGLEDYTYGKYLFESERICGSVDVYFTSNSTTYNVPIVDRVGKFSIWGARFCIYFETNRYGRSDVYALSSTSSTFGGELQYSNFAYINYLPTEYLNLAEVKETLDLPAMWAKLSDKPFDLDTYAFVAGDYRVQGFSENNTTIAGFAYISAPITVLPYMPTHVEAFLIGNARHFRLHQLSDTEWVSNHEYVGNGPAAVYVKLLQDVGYQLFLLSDTSFAGQAGWLTKAFVARTLDTKVLPMDDIISDVISALPLYNGEVTEV